MALPVDSPSWMRSQTSSQFFLVISRIPVMSPRMYQTSTKKIKGARAHMLFQYTFYKGLDVSQ